ncbi:hypothetical protein EJ04DRAFT_39806 [Polyplosphaeria fusca]|uniref:Uncharacterized protein n=1 Tax=Polyplosphaeria fusca TaxID=682080 RepID=A0A9P4V3H8_9PLEO|nr:hypothetical protein EJ04DRAFT_39806 [Polyplosphaeria fusca]
MRVLETATSQMTDVTRVESSEGFNGSACVVTSRCSSAACAPGCRVTFRTASQRQAKAGEGQDNVGRRKEANGCASAWKRWGLIEASLKPPWRAFGDQNKTLEMSSGAAKASSRSPGAGGEKGGRAVGEGSKLGVVASVWRRRASCTSGNGEGGRPNQWVSGWRSSGTISLHALSW